jgi:hypothetical protein
LTKRMMTPHAGDPGRQMGLEAIKEFGGIPGATQRGAGPVVQFAESIAESAIPARGMAVRRQQSVDEAVSSLALDTVRKASPLIRSDEEMSKLFFQESDNLRKIYQLQVHQKYQVVDDLTKHNVNVNTNNAVRLTAGGFGPGKTADDPVTKEVFRQLRVPAVWDQTTGQVTAPGYMGKEGFFELVNAGGRNKTSFSNAQRLSSALKQIGRDNPELPGYDPIQRRAGRLAEQMAHKIDESMDTAANDYKQTSIQALVGQGVPLAQAQAQVRDFAQEYQAAKSFYKENIADKFETETFRGLANALSNEPAKFSRLAMAADSPGKLKALREAAPNLWPDMQARVLRSIIDKATDAHPSGAGLELDELISRGLVKQMSGEKLNRELGRLGPDYVRELTQGNVDLHDIQRLGAAMEVANQRAPGQGKMFVALAMTGPAAGLLLSPFGYDQLDWTKSGMIMLGPNALSLALTRPSVLNMMERGLIGGPKSEAFAKFSAFAVTEHLKEFHDLKLEQDALSQPSKQLSQPVGPALSQAPAPLPPPMPNVPQLPMLRQQPLAGQPPRF